MEPLKVKFKLNGLEFELEGNQDVVKEEFEKFKGFITNQLLPNTDISFQNPSSTKKKELPIQINSDDDEIPQLKEVVKRDLPNNETDWVLVYAYYITNGGQETFTEVNIRKQYEQTGRKNTTRIGNITNKINALLGKGYIKVHNDKEYILKESGVAQALEVLKGNSKSKTIKSTSKKAKVSDEPLVAKTTKKNQAKSATKFKVLPDLNYRPQGRVSLIDFINSLPFNSNPEKILGIVYYCKETLKLEKVGPNHIYTGFKELKVPITPTFYQGIINVKNRNSWLTFEDIEDIGYSIQGGNHVEYDLPKKKE